MEQRKVTLITSFQDMDRRVKIAAALTRNGYKATILNWDLSGNRHKVESIDGCKIQHFRLKPPNSRRWCVAACHLIWWPHATLSLLKSDADVYHPENLYNLIPAIPAKILKRREIVYHLADYTASSFEWPKLIRKLFAWLERLCLNFADGIIITDEQKGHDIAGTAPKKLALVMNCPADLRDKLNAQEDQDEFIIYYGGWISETRGLRQLCKAIQNLKDVKLVVAGSGPDERKLKPVFDSHENVQFKGPLSSAESLKWTQKAAVAFAFCGDPRIPNNQFALPNRLFDAMMCGTPVLANSEALPVAEIVERKRCGLLVPYEDIRGLRSAIEKLKEDPQIRIEMGRNARKAFECEYNWAEMESRLVRLYEEILSTGGSR